MKYKCIYHQRKFNLNGITTVIILFSGPLDTFPVHYPALGH